MTPYEQALAENYTHEEIQKYLASKNPDVASRIQEAEQEGHNTDEIFKYIQEKQNPPETLAENSARQAGRSGSRIAETIIGAPREFGDFLESLVPEKLLIQGAEKVGLGEGAKTLLETTKKFAPYKLLPKTQDVRKFSEDLFGEKVKPQNEWEEKADEVISDFTALALPLPGTKLKVLKPALLALGGNTAAGLIGKMGGDDKEQAYAKLGTIFTGSLINPGGAKKAGMELYNQAKQARPDRVKVTVPAFNAKLNSIERELKKGGSATWKDKIFKKIKEIRDAGQGNNIEVGELERFKPALNDMIGEMYAEKNILKSGIKSARRYATQIAKVIDQGLTEYGKVNPKWEAPYRAANEVYGGIAQSHKARDYIGKTLGRISPHLTAGLFGLAKNASGGFAPAIGATAAGYGALSTAELLTRIYKSPTLRKYYFGVLENAVKENAALMQRNLESLEKGLEKDNKKESNRNPRSS